MTLIENLEDLLKRSEKYHAKCMREFGEKNLTQEARTDAYQRADALAPFLYKLREILAAEGSIPSAPPPYA